MQHIYCSHGLKVLFVVFIATGVIVPVNMTALGKGLSAAHL
jgi:hypothetical protein